MDQLFDSVAADDPEFVVPYLCSNEPEYDGLDFITYPIRRQWMTPEQPYDWFNSCRTIDELATRAQSWLYFGLLEAWLGEKITHSHLLRPVGPFNDNYMNDSVIPRRQLAVGGRLVQSLVLDRLVAFFGQKKWRLRENRNIWFYLASPFHDMVEEVNLQPLKDKLERFTFGIFCCHQALPHSEMLDQFAHFYSTHIPEDPRNEACYLEVSEP